MGVKKYKNGMYGGKFMPFHKGHLSCIAKASAECEVANLILFYNGVQEREILKTDKREFLTPEARMKVVEKVAKMFPNVRPVFIDVTASIMENGEEDWDLQTPMVINAIGMPDAVYASEPAYGEYFSRAYPPAEYRIVDVDRTLFPVSGTKVRHMTDEERKQWMV